MVDIPFPTVNDLLRARAVYVLREHRYGAWDLARQAVADADGPPPRHTRAEAIAALLRDWNSEYYRTRPKKAASLLKDLPPLLDRFNDALNGYE